MGTNFKIETYLDAGSMITIIVTFVLFVVSLFFTGFTHDLLLEAGVFLVSVKLILMAYRSSVNMKKVDQELKEIKTLIKENNEKK